MDFPWFIYSWRKWNKVKLTSLRWSNSCPLSQWCHPTISSSPVPFFCLQPFPASGSSLFSQLFASGSRSNGASVSASILPRNLQGWLPLGFTGLISLKSKGLSRAPHFKSINSSVHSLLYGSTLASTHDYYWKNHCSMKQILSSSSRNIHNNLIHIFEFCRN